MMIGGNEDEVSKFEYTNSKDERASMMVATESKEGRELKIVQFELLPTRDG